jgi:thiamine-monophosphate kinase
MNELELVARIRRAAGTPLIGDDCAVLRARPSEDLLVTTDFLIEDVHFRRATHSAADCGHRTLARGLSDVAAMGGTPLYCFVSLALGPAVDQRWVDGFYRGLLKLAREHKVTLAGGDLTRAAKITCDIVVLGAVPRGRALRRSGAKPGDSIYVSGALGAAAVSRYTAAPVPRLALGRSLRTRATACMDLSDGLGLDLHRLCVESGVAASIDHPLPVAPEATIEQAWSGGEDYELLFTASPRTRVPRSFQGLPLTRIGSIVAGRPGRLRLFGVPVPPQGWDPFRR